MALTSPGVEVTITDQSQYLPAPTNSVPLVVLATAQNKADASGTGVAVATTAANANKLYQVTSQRDLDNACHVPVKQSLHQPRLVPEVILDQGRIQAGSQGQFGQRNIDDIAFAHDVRGRLQQQLACSGRDFARLLVAFGHSYGGSSPHQG